jgi:hypothetical protein
MKNQRPLQSENTQQKRISSTGAKRPGSGKAYETNPLARYSCSQDPADFSILNVILKKVTMETFFLDAPLTIKTNHQLAGK